MSQPELLLQPPIPRPMTMVNPRSIMGSSAWMVIREATVAACGGRCDACGRKHKDGVEAHECYEIDYKRYRMTFTRVVGLCYKCHKYIHLGFMKSLVRKGDMSERELHEIISRGDKIIKKARHLFKFPRIGGEGVWHKWRLVYDGKEYGPRFKNAAAWEKFYGS